MHCVTAFDLHFPQTFRLAIALWRARYLRCTPRNDSDGPPREWRVTRKQTWTNCASQFSLTWKSGACLSLGHVSFGSVSSFVYPVVGKFSFWLTRFFFFTALIEKQPPMRPVIDLSSDSVQPISVYKDSIVVNSNVIHSLLTSKRHGQRPECTDTCARTHTYTGHSDNKDTNNDKSANVLRIIKLWGFWSKCNTYPTVNAYDAIVTKFLKKERSLTFTWLQLMISFHYIFYYACSTQLYFKKIPSHFLHSLLESNVSVYHPQ